MCGGTVTKKRSKLGFGRYWYRVSADTAQYRRYRYRPILFAVLVPDTINTTSVHQSNNALKLFGVKCTTAHAKRPSRAGTWRKRRECHLADFRCTAHHRHRACSDTQWIYLQLMNFHSPLQCFNVCNSDFLRQ